MTEKLVPLSSRVVSSLFENNRMDAKWVSDNLECFAIRGSGYKVISLTEGGVIQWYGKVEGMLSPNWYPITKSEFDLCLSLAETEIKQISKAVIQWWHGGIPMLQAVNGVSGRTYFAVRDNITLLDPKPFEYDGQRVDTFVGQGTMFAPRVSEGYSTNPVDYFCAFNY